jgi:hypothetical protein
MAGHRFEIGECVTSIEKRFPNGERRTDLTVVERLTSGGEPQYQLRDSAGLAQCVLAESQLSPKAPPQEAAERLEARAPAWLAPGSGSPWSA